MQARAARQSQPGQSRQADWQIFILYGVQLGHFVSMYWIGFSVECFRTCSNTFLHGSR